MFESTIQGYLALCGRFEVFSRRGIICEREYISKKIPYYFYFQKTKTSNFIFFEFLKDEVITV